jgi:hypothetical protein
LDGFLKKNTILKDQFIINPAGFYDNLHYMGSYLVEKEYFNACFPAFSMADSIATNVLSNLSLSNYIQLQKSQALSELGLINEAMVVHSFVSKRTNFKRRVEEETLFENSHIPLSTLQFQEIRTFLGTSPIEKAKQILSHRGIIEFELTKVKIIVAVLKIPFQTLSYQFSNQDDNLNWDYDSCMTEVYTLLRNILWKCISQVQVQMKSKSEFNLNTNSDTTKGVDIETSIALNLQILNCFQLLASVCYQQRRYTCSHKWYLYYNLGLFQLSIICKD